MIPLSDSIRSRAFPFLTLVLIGLNVYVFFLEVTSSDIQSFIETWGLVPASVTPNPATWITFLTSMFLHGGWLHIISNMLFLWVFADNVEDRMGFVGFIIFYLFCGFVAALTQYAINPTSTIPIVGASGAVAGILAAYWRLFPKAYIHTLIPLGFFITSADVPAWLMIGLWFATQIFNGTASIALVTATAEGGGGVAYWAHIGGFVAGLLLVNLFTARRRRRQGFLRRIA
jgi:membrane associated rhomboid family serine protease